MTPGPFAQWLSWEPGQPPPRDVSPLAEALLIELHPADAVTLWLVNEAGSHLDQGLTARSSGPSYAHRGKISVEAPSSAVATSIWQRCAFRPRSIRQLEQSKMLLAHRLQVGNQLLGIVAVEDPNHSLTLARRMARAVTWAAPALLAFRQSRRRAIEYGFWRASAQIAHAYAHSESLDGPVMLRAIAAAVRSSLQLDRCLLLESSVSDHRLTGHYVAGIRHLWPSTDKKPVDNSGFLARLATEESGQAAEGLVLWTPLAEDDKNRLTLLADNLLSEVPLPPLEHAGWAGLGQAVSGFWRLWREFEAMRYRAERDELTGLYNRAGGLPLIRDWVARSGNWSVPVALLLFDVDHFKGLNDRFGHVTGDNVLRAIGRWLNEQLRPEDVALRYGGDEFLVLLPEVSPLIRPQAVDRILEGLKTIYPAPGSPAITVSIGAALAPHHGLDPLDLIEAADRALYRVKAQGGNAWALVDSPV